MPDNMPLKLSKLAPGEYAIRTVDDGLIVAERPGVPTVAVDNREGNGVIFHRNAIKYPGGRHVRWLVAELDGVRLYHEGDRMVLTKEDRYG